DRGAGQHDGPGAQPGTRADGNRGVHRPLLSDRHLRVGVAVVLVCDVNVRAGVHVVADLNGLVPNDVAAAPEYDAAADTHDGFGPEVALGDESGAERDVRPDEGEVPDRDPAFAEESALRKCDR